MANLLRVDSDLNKRILKEIEQLNNIENYCKQQIQPPFDDVLASHLNFLINYHTGKTVEANTFQSKISTAFQRILKNEGNWILPVLKLLAVQLRLSAKRADDEQLEAGGKADKQEDAARILNTSFNLTVNDRSPIDQSKKWGSLLIINQLLKIYFELNHFSLCKNLMKQVENPGFPPLDKFPLSEVVTYRFFIGRLYMFDGNYKRAEENLSFAFKNCPSRSYKNKRLILLFLVPVKMLLGEFPQMEILQRYQLHQFVDLARAVKLGNLEQFNSSLALYEDFFIQKGIYLILEKLKMITYRNLFRRIYLILQNNKIRLALFVQILQWLEVEIDLDETECILANLIASGYIRGYISHKMSCLVLSQKEPFSSNQIISIPTNNCNITTDSTAQHSSTQHSTAQHNKNTNWNLFCGSMN
eukprot:TRINITY_DN3678_c0_g1_i1.p1 TRINITY_DN3678_c0_g1~~TRINITY_DN3678_c0_g1_i1.p1  ORF type:complete len:463 (+),score=99.74 TRINITY_DN3678_c0_g1_i1:145-1389(+)